VYGPHQVVVSLLHGGAEDGRGKRAWRRLIRPLVSRESTGTFQLLSFPLGPSSLVKRQLTRLFTSLYSLYFFLQYALVDLKMIRSKQFDRGTQYNSHYSSLIEAVAEIHIRNILNDGAEYK
jgi:hypothetical protein